ncbi:MAG: glycoside hydrolase family 3 [Desulfobulbus sp.]|nr:MAG: glycoside hydrolase family 3 [Desulfobulbus sp.]
MKIGQMFMVGFRGTTVDAGHWIVKDIVRRHLGGVILFDRNVDGSVQNISSPAQLQALTTTLQEYGNGRLLIGVDQEGGRVCRLKARDGFPETVSAEMLAGFDDEKAAATADKLAATLAAHGITMNFAPVVDLDCNPDNPIIGRYQRSFSYDPEQVVRCARLVIEAHHRHGIGCCLKHFPGHGSAGADSHLGFVDVTGDWQEQELVPFARLIDMDAADAVMTAHIVNRRLDPRGMVATLSRPIITGLLRQRLGFDGVVISDDLQMRAITKKWGFREAVRRAVLAGVDLLVIGNNLALRQDALQAGIGSIQKMLDRGEIDADYIKASLVRISRLQRKTAGKIPWSSNKPTALS